MEASGGQSDADILNFPRQSDGDFSIQNSRPLFMQPDAYAAAFPPVTDDITTIEGTARIARADVPWTLHGPANPADVVSTLVMKPMEGLGVSGEAMQGLGEAFAARGILALIHDQPRHQDLFANLHPKHLFNPARLAAQAGWAAMRDAMRDEEVYRQYGVVDNFVLLGYSWGGKKAKDIAERHPDHTAKLLLAGPVGGEHHTTADFFMPRIESGRLVMPRAVNFALRELPDKNNRKMMGKNPVSFAIGEAHHILRHVDLTIRETVSATRARVVDDVPKLEEMGIQTEAMYMEDDTLIPAEPNVAHGRKFLGDRIRVIRGFNHLSFLNEPDATAEHALDMSRDVHAANEPDRTHLKVSS